jgi:hypothetical protein
VVFEKNNWFFFQILENKISEEIEEKKKNEKWKQNNARQAQHPA